MKSIVRFSAVLVTSSCFLGCSLFGPRLQTITVSSEPAGADVMFNGSRVGQTPLRYQVHRGEDLLVEVRKEGHRTEYRTSHRTLSTLGIMDVIGGWVIVIPFVGLLSPAAWEHEPSVYGVILSSEGSEDSE